MPILRLVAPLSVKRRHRGLTSVYRSRWRTNRASLTRTVKGLLLNLSKIEEKLQATLKEKAGTDVTADCGGKLRAAKTGDTFTCQLKNKEGQTRNVQITVKNEKGELNVKL
jgi:hypothetical protein